MLSVNVRCFLLDQSLHSYHNITQEEKTHRTLMQHKYIFLTSFSGVPDLYNEQIDDITKPLVQPSK